MKTRISVLLFTLSLLLDACTSTRAPAPEATCSGACENARSRCGSEALKPRTGTCEDVCTNAQAHGHSFHTSCLASAPTCEGVMACQ